MKTSTHVNCSVPVLFSLLLAVPLESLSDTPTDGTCQRNRVEFHLHPKYGIGLAAPALIPCRACAHG